MTPSHNLSWLPDELVPVAFRLARADTVAGELGDVCLSWSRGDDDNGPLELVQVARELGFLDLDVKSIRPVPPIAAMLFSEAINHLRSALDNVVYYLAEQANGHAFTSQEASLVQFFIRSDQAAYDKKVAELASKRGLSQLAPGHLLGDRMRALQPFNDARTVPAIPVGQRLTVPEVLEVLAVLDGRPGVALSALLAVTNEPLDASSARDLLAPFTAIRRVRVRLSLNPDGSDISLELGMLAPAAALEVLAALAEGRLAAALAALLSAPAGRPTNNTRS